LFFLVGGLLMLGGQMVIELGLFFDVFCEEEISLLKFLDFFD
jgi:hypothetical protein